MNCTELIARKLGYFSQRFVFPSSMLHRTSAKGTTECFTRLAHLNTSSNFTQNAPVPGID